MDNSTWIVPAAVAVLVPILMTATGRKNSAQANTVDGLVELRLPRVFVFFGWLSLVLALGFAAGAVGLGFEGHLGVAMLIAGLAVFFLWGAVVMIRDGRYHRVTYSEEIFRVTDGQRRTEHCAWEELVSGKVHAISKMIHLRIADGRVLKVNGYLIGSDGFFDMMARRTSLPVADLVRQARYPGN